MYLLHPVAFVSGIAIGHEYAIWVRQFYVMIIAIQGFALAG